MNHVSIMGRLVADPTLTETKEGKKIVRFRVAVPDGFSNEGKPLAIFLNCVYFAKSKSDTLPDRMSQYCKKGKYIGVLGKLTTRTYISKADGLEKEITEIQAFSIDYVFSGSGNAEESKASIPPNAMEIVEMI